MTQSLEKTHVDRCREDIDSLLNELELPRDPGELALALHLSISHILRTRLARLQAHGADVPSLPSPLREQWERWRSTPQEDALRRTVVLLADEWRDATSELLTRLAWDRAELLEFFCIRPDARLLGISVPLGDTHNRGRTVQTVTFDDGTIIVYKPRPVDAEVVFGRLIGSPQISGFRPRLTACEMLERNGYGWSRYVFASRCHTTEEAVRFYERQGAYLCLFYLSNGSDCIAENFIGCGEHPVWVDTECLCRPHLSISQLPSGTPACFGDSILETHFVFWANDRQEPPRRNTALNASCLSDRADVFGHDGVLQDRYVRSVINGFSRLYKWITNETGTDFIRQGFSGDQRVRVIIHQTALYDAMARILLVSPVDSVASVRDSLGELLSIGRNGMQWPDKVVDIELDALERGDVPYWMARPSSKHLVEACGEVSPRLIEQTGAERLSARLSRLGVQDHDNQVWLIDTHLRIPHMA